MRRGLFGWKTTVNLYSLSQRYLQVVWRDSTVRQSLLLMIAKLNAGIDLALTGDRSTKSRKSAITGTQYLKLKTDNSGS